MDEARKRSGSTGGLRNLGDRSPPCATRARGVAAADRTEEHCSPIADVADDVRGAELVSAEGARKSASQRGDVDGVLHLSGG
jgi:hypothetical protein